MALKQLARGLWAAFTNAENPFSTPNGMEENLRVIDDHLGLYTLQQPLAPGSALPDAPADGDGQIYTDGTYATYNGGSWKTYWPRKGVRAVLATGTDSWLNTGSSWEQYSVVDTGPAAEAANAARDEAEVFAGQSQLAAAVDYSVGTLADRNALTPTAGQTAFVRATGLFYDWSGSAWGTGYEGFLFNKADKAVVVPVVDRVGRSFPTTTDVVAQRPGTSNFASGDGHYSWAPGIVVGQDVAAGTIVSIYGTRIILSATVAKVRQRIWGRPTSAGTANTPPGAGANDVLLSDRMYTVGELGVVPGGALTPVAFELPSITMEAGHSYQPQTNFYDAAGLNASGGFWRSSGATGWTNERRGFFDNGNTIPAADMALAYWLGASRYVVDGMPELQQQTAETAAKLSASFDTVRQVTAERPSTTSWPSSDGHYAWTFGAHCAVGGDIVPGAQIPWVSMDAQLIATLAKVRMRLWSRPTEAGTLSTYPGNGPHDTLVASITKTIAELGLEARAGDLQTVRFDTSIVAAQGDTTYLAEFWYFDAANGNVGAGGARNNLGASMDQTQRGWYRGGSALASPAAISWAFGNYIYRPKAIDASSDRLDTRESIRSAQAAASGYTVSIQGIRARGDTTAAFSSSVVLAAPTTGNVAGEARTLTDRRAGLPPLNYYNQTGGLAHSNVSAAVVKDATTNAVLVLGTDYAIEPVNGYVSLQAQGTGTTNPSRNVTVDYHWSQCRYDLICVNAESLALSVVQGTERRRDAGEVLPEAGDSTVIPLFYARVADGFPVELVPVWYLDGGIHRDLRAAAEIDYQNQRRALAPILEMARRGETIRVAVVGDSIGQQGGGVPPGESVPNNAPNGPYRDRPEYFGMNIGSDLVDAIPRYNTGDGAGAVHTRTTHLWDVVRALEELGGVVEYYNFCIGGTTSGAGVNNGGSATLRNAVWAVAPHLLITHYGMNETGSAATEANLNDLFAAAAANGVKAVLAIGMPRPGALKTTAFMSAVRTTLRATRRAAEFFRVDGQLRGAFFDTSRLMDDAYIGALGVSTKDLGGADHYHHPGLHELRVYGAELKRMFKGN